MKSLKELSEKISIHVVVCTQHKIAQILYSTYCPECKTIKIRYENTDVFVTVELSEIVEYNPDK